MSTYVIKEDRFGERYISREDDGQYIAGAKQVRREVWRAAAAVLAPEDPLVIAIAKALQDEVDGAPWDEQDAAFRDGWYGAAYRALETLRAHVEGS